MLKTENYKVYNWEGAIRGMRNPLNSWEKSDSQFNEAVEITTLDEDGRPRLETVYVECLDIGPNDMALMKKLIKAGSDHRKFMRQILVTVDITGPLYWWKEFDTYKVGTTANSCSTMHTIHKKEFGVDDFSCERMYHKTRRVLHTIIDELNHYRSRYLETSNKEDWMQMIQLLPTSYNQMRTVTLNYEVLKNMYNSRKNHKLNEWHVFCDWIKTLPYSELITD